MVGDRPADADVGLLLDVRLGNYGAILVTKAYFRWRDSEYLAGRGITPGWEDEVLVVVVGIVLLGNEVCEEGRGYGRECEDGNC